MPAVASRTGAGAQRYVVSSTCEYLGRFAQSAFHEGGLEDMLCASTAQLVLRCIRRMCSNREQPPFYRRLREGKCMAGVRSSWAASVPQTQDADGLPSTSALVEPAFLSGESFANADGTHDSVFSRSASQVCNEACTCAQTSSAQAHIIGATSCELLSMVAQCRLPRAVTQSNRQALWAVSNVLTRLCPQDSCWYTGLSGKTEAWFCEWRLPEHRCQRSRAPIIAR